VKKIAVLSMAILLIATLFVGCGAPAKPKIGLSFSDFATERWARERDQMTEQRIGQVGVWVRLPKKSLPVHVAEDPLSAVAEGTGKVLSELAFLRKVTTTDS